MNETLKLVDETLRTGNVGRAIRQMENYLAAWPEQQTAEKLMEVREDYDRMESYWQQGGNDPEREALYQRLLQRVYVVYANVMHYHRMKASPYQNSLYTRVRQGQRDWSLTAIRQEMEGFVSNVALLQLEPDNKRQTMSETLYRDHQRQMNQLFEYVLTSRQWSDSVGSQFTEMLTSPTIDSIDQQLLIAAVTLSLLNQFDMAKFRMLTEVYRLSQDEAVRQRALVGWALSASDTYSQIYPEQHELITALLESDQACQELTELQIQLMRRMMDMQKQGVDVFYHGFSQIKRYPFFYDISNWLVPFYTQHPDIAQFVAKQGQYHYLEKVFAANTFCNSDKYSFVIAMQEVIDRLPQQVRDMIVHGEYSAEELAAAAVEPSPALERRLYLMDIYRFFRLFSHASELYNPFIVTKDEAGGCCFFRLKLFAGTRLERYKAQIVRQLKKHQMNSTANSLLLTFTEAYRDVQYYMWVKDYAHVLLLDPDNERALLGFARSLYETKLYERALEYFEKLMNKYPEKSNYQLYVAVCLIQVERYEEALKMLYRLNYEQPENDSVNRALAWAQTCTGQLEQAHHIYEQLVGLEQVDIEDLKNYGYCLWLQGDILQAKTQFQEYCKRCEESSPVKPDFFDVEWLKKRGISIIEINMMLSLL